MSYDLALRLAVPRALNRSAVTAEVATSSPVVTAILLELANQAQLNPKIRIAAIS